MINRAAALPESSALQLQNIIFDVWSLVTPTVTNIIQDAPELAAGIN